MTYHHVIQVFYALFGCVAGYISARIYNMVGGLYWRTNVLMTAFFVSGIVFAIFFILNLFLWGAGSSAAIPFTTLLALLCLWFGVSLPLTVVCSLLGFRKPVPQLQVRKNYVSKEIHYINRSCYLVIMILIMRGIPPFACSFIQFFIIYNSLWSGQYCYRFKAFMAAFLLLVVACATTASAHTLYCLQRGDYRWWWRSFLSTGSPAIYLFLFSVNYFVNKTSIAGALSYALYFGYTFIMGFLFFILIGVAAQQLKQSTVTSLMENGTGKCHLHHYYGGTIGFLASLLFVYKIYFEPMLSKSINQDQVMILPEEKC